MASYPRKFREKIALHAQKQAEETAAFEAIINETRQATSRASGASNLQQPINSHLGRSLPDVHQLASNNNSINLVNILDSLAEMKKSPDGNSSKLRRRERSASPNDSLQKKPVLYDRHRQSSPYGSVSNNYLSPTLNDGSWRRAASESAIHTIVSAMPINDSGTFNAQPGNEGVKMVNGSGAEVPYNHPPICITQSHPLPLSTSEMNTNSLIPYGPNGGSLPDLSIMNFSSPSSNPVDMPYSTGNSSLATRRAETSQRHTLPEPLVFTQSTSNHLLGGGSAIVNNRQVDSQSPLHMDSTSVFSPLLSPQPIITLTDASLGENCGRDQILYSEDLEAIQEYLFNMQSPMVSLSPSFFRQQPDSSNVTFQSCGELQSATVHPLTQRNAFNTGVSVNSENKNVLGNNPTSQPSNQPRDGASNSAKITSTQSFHQQQNQPNATRQQPIAPRQPPVTSQQYVQQPKQMPTSDKHTVQQPSQQYQLQTVLQLNRLQQGLQQQQTQPLLQQHLNTHQLQQVQAIYLQQQQVQSVCQQQQQQQQQVMHQQGQFMPVGMQPLHPTSVIQYQTFPQQTVVCQTSLGGSFAPEGGVVVPIMESRLKTEPDAAVSMHSGEQQHQSLQLHLASGSCINGISNNSQPSPILKPPPAYVDRSRDWADMSTDLTSSGKPTTDVACVGSAITFNTADLMSPLVAGVDIFSGISEAELLTAEDALSLGLDPLAVEELKMLTESASLIDDPDIENSFRQDRSFDIHRQ